MLLVLTWVKVDALLGSAPGSGSVRSVVSGFALSSRVSGLSSPFLVLALVCFWFCVRVVCVRFFAWFCVRVCFFACWCGVWCSRAWVGVRGLVLVVACAGGGVVVGWWARARGVARGLVGGVSVLGLVLAGVVGVLVLVGVLVCFCSGLACHGV